MASLNSTFMTAAAVPLRRLASSASGTGHRSRCGRMLLFSRGNHHTTTMHPFVGRQCAAAPVLVTCNRRSSTDTSTGSTSSSQEKNTEAATKVVDNDDGKYDKKTSAEQVEAQRKEEGEGDEEEQEHHPPPPQPGLLASYGIPLIATLSLAGAFYIWSRLENAALFKRDHDFKPVYDDTGKLVGFTHPEMVQAVDRQRVRLAEEQQQQKKNEA